MKKNNSLFSSVILVMMSITISSGDELAYECMIHTDKITVSGYSGGGGMAQIVHFSHSSLLMGIGLFSSEAYNCHDPNSIPEDNPSRLDENMDAKSFEEYSNHTVLCLTELEERGLVDPLSNIKEQRLYNWVGTRDAGLSLGTHIKIIDLYCEYLGSVSLMRTVIQRGIHEVPVMHAECGSSKKRGKVCPAGSCGYTNGPLEMLNFLFAGIGVTFSAPRAGTVLQPLITFDQSAFFKGIRGNVSMRKYGYWYIPLKCKSKTAICYFHMFLHGCNRSKPDVRIRQIYRYGFLQIAEENGIIMVFPMASSCFDTYRGFTNRNFHNKRGPQVRAMERIIRRFIN